MSANDVEKGGVKADRPIGFTTDGQSNMPPAYGQAYYAQSSGAYVATTAPESNQTNVLITDHSSDFREDFEGHFQFSEKSIRLAFIRKVYSILTCQLVITFGVIAIFTFVPEVRAWARSNPWLYIAALVVVFVLVIAMACCVDVRRKYPQNIIFLLIFTLAEGAALGSVCVYFDVMSVWIAAAICIFLVIALTLFAFQSRIDFTVMSASIFVFSLCFMITMILCLVMRTYWSYMIYAGLGAFIFSVYIVFDTQVMLGGTHKYAVSPEEYVFASLNLYLDIVNLFLYILMIVGGGRKG